MKSNKKVFMQEVVQKLYRHSFVRYVVIGGTTFALDFALLVLLHDVFNAWIILAATISYWSSIAFNFLANRIWTFNAHEQKIAKHLAAYLALLGMNYLFTIGIIALGNYFGVHYTISKIVAVAIQMIWTYIAYKKLIFK